MPVVAELGHRIDARVDQEKMFEYLREPAKEIKNRSLLLINTRLFLAGLSGDPNNNPTLAEVPSATWDSILGLKQNGSQPKGDFQVVWLMGIYTLSSAAQQDSRRHFKTYAQEFPNLRETDVVASPFAIVDYNPNPKIAKSWAEFDKVVSEELHKRGAKVILDIVPNHVALDHPWIKEHPEYLIKVPEYVAMRNPEQYYKYTNKKGETSWFARGKNMEPDGSSDVWTDTLQLNHALPEVRKKIIEDTLAIMYHADGIRFDTVDLLDPYKFIGIWGDTLGLTDAQKEYLIRNDFWHELADAVQKKADKMGKEEPTSIGEMWQENNGLGKSFNNYYEFPLYHSLASGSLVDVKHRLGELYERTKEKKGRPLVFTENHDVERAAEVFGEKESLAAATITAAIPGTIWMVQLGQEEGSTIRHPMQVITPRYQQPNQEMQKYYAQLHNKLRNSRVFQEGEHRLQVDPYSNIIAQEAQIPEMGGAIVCTNFSGQRVGRLIKLPEGLKKTDVAVYDLHEERFLPTDTIYKPDDNGGFYVELSPWKSQVVYYGLRH